MARCISSRRCVSAYPQPRRFSLGSWLLFLPSYTRWVSACGATSTTGSSSPPLGSLSSTISRLSWISVGSWVLWSTPRNPTSFPLRWFSISGWSSMPSLLWLLRRRIASPGLYQPPENFCPPTRLPQLFGSLCWGCFPPWLTSSLEGDFARGLFSFAFIGLGIRWTSRLLWLGPWTAFRICGGGSTCLGCLRGCPSVRCLDDLGRRVGCSSGLSCRFRPLGRVVVSSPYQRQGAPCRPSGSPLLSVICFGQDSGGVMRQRHCCGVSSQRRGHQVSFSQLHRTGDPALVGISPHQSGSIIYPGLPQRLGGHSLLSSSAPEYRVVPQHGGLSVFASSVASPGRFVCHLGESPLFDLFFSDPGPSVSGHGRLSPVLGRSSGICVSSVVHHSPGLSQAPGVSGDGAHAGGSVLASEALVSGPPPAVAGPPSGPSRPSRPLVPASVSSALPGSPQATASCLETLRRFTRAAGFSSAVASQASLALRPSSRTNYQLKWSVYCSWSRSHGHSVSRPTLSKVVVFLCWLRSSRGLIVSSIKGYCSLLSVVFRSHLPTLSFGLSDFRRRSASCVLLLGICLCFFSSSTLRRSSLCLRRLFALCRRLFLLALATAKHVGELQALSSVVTFVGFDACLSYVPQFVAKSELLTRSIPRSFLVKSLSDFAAGLDEDLLLCPVRALCIYLDRLVLSLPFAIAFLSLLVAPFAPCQRMRYPSFCARSFTRPGRLDLRWVQFEPMRFAVSPPLSPSTGTGQSPRSWSPPLGAKFGVFLFLPARHSA